MTVLVTGARGAVGSHVRAGLLAAGVEVRAAGRDPRVLPDGGGTRVRLDLADPSSFGPALEGVDRVFVYVTGDLHAFAVAAVAAGVRHAVLLSSEAVSVEADPEPGGIAAHHAEAEAALRGAGLPTTALRPGAFAGNTAQWSRGIAAGVVELPFPQASTTPIDERDIADVAVAALLGEPADDSPRLSGPESLTMAEQVGLVAEHLGRPIEVRAVDPEQAREQMARFAPPGVVDSLFRYWREADGVRAPTTDEVERRTGHPARTYRTWLQECFTAP
ncbi:NAD(P)H-binding protein [Actinomycetospora soli]|uniref:NAD(P)H-binding protein n=1 Tax=Actinomycetospora soli TaxID=2893887 RepID=UPI001E59B579|nr:NAD(P)H-binding protein [Actinomycetospora soli]MCD2185622.1 NAD(P)H-binding protein [Actinomycetospora soli]